MRQRCVSGSQRAPAGGLQLLRSRLSFNERSRGCVRVRIACEARAVLNPTFLRSDANGRGVHYLVHTDAQSHPPACAPMRPSAAIRARRPPLRCAPGALPIAIGRVHTTVCRVCLAGTPAGIVSIVASFGDSSRPLAAGSTGRWCISENRDTVFSQTRDSVPIVAPPSICCGRLDKMLCAVSALPTAHESYVVSHERLRAPQAPWQRTQRTRYSTVHNSALKP